jgi:molecular chaperone DnaK
MKPVNYGIDLGTTNSLITKFEDGKVQVYKNPIGFKETLASVVAYRQDRTLIGDKAREYLTKDPVNVFGGFKRKMGTDEKYYVVNLDENVTPVELSSLILKELKKWTPPNELMEACVITIPASFDSMQSNATLKAGEMAGFKDVFLLQEPIAACLAFFNANKQTEKKEGYWIVYDLGGGTFDVALVKSSADELKIVDHEGNNFLGGMDFDSAIINQLIIPEIIKQTSLENFEEELYVKHGKYEMLYYQIMYYAEEAKKELSQTDETYIEFSFTIDDKTYDLSIPITKIQVDAIFLPLVNETIQLLNKVLENNKLTNKDIHQIILVGGSTYLPQVREQLALQTNIALNYALDPTTSVAIGAGFYASNKQYEPTINEVTKSEEFADELLSTIDFNTSDIEIDVNYNRSSRDTEEVLLIACNGSFETKTYRIIRSDGGFDTGFVKLKSKKTEFLPLIESCANTFTLNIYDEHDNVIIRLKRDILISQGMYSIDGQPLPNDICVEVDDIENKTTRLETIFERNSLLPQKRTLYREISKTIKKGTTDSIIINILEGDKNSRASSNLTIGCIEISGKDLQTDLIKGSDLEIQIHITDSRVLNTSVFLVMTQQEFKNVFSISEKQISLARLKDQFLVLENELTDTAREFQYNDDTIWEIKATNLLSELEEIKPTLFKLKDKDKTDTKYILAEKITRISQEYDKLGGNERIAILLENYFNNKETVKQTIHGVDFDKDDLLKRFQRIEQAESAFLNSKNVSVIENKLQQLDDLHLKALSATNSFLISRFFEYKTYDDTDFKDHRAAKTIIKMADNALENERFSEFRRHIFSISSLLNIVHFNYNAEFKGTGIG